MYNDCPLCEQKDIEIERLKLELQRLRSIIDRVKSALMRVIKEIDNAMNEAKIIISQPSGVPRGIWAFAKGVIKIGALCLGYLKYVLGEIEKC